MIPGPSWSVLAVRELHAAQVEARPPHRPSGMPRRRWARAQVLRRCRTARRALPRPRYLSPEAIGNAVVVSTASAWFGAWR